MSAKPDARYPICLEGERACPPEDCGGVLGYTQLLAIIQNPQHDEYEHTVSWLGDRFDSEEFDVLAINQELRHYHQQGRRLPMQLYPQKEATHPPPVAQSINRLVAIIKPREPFLRWLESQPDWDLDMTLEELRTDCTALLIPEFDDNEQARNYLKANCRIVFEMQLNGWYIDPAMWPKKRNLSIFRQWFDVEIHSTAVDTLNEDIRKDAY